MKIAKTIICGAALGLAVAVSPAFLQARVTLPGIFTDNMVLQRNDTITLFGTADKGKRVTVKAGWGKNVTTNLPLPMQEALTRFRFPMVKN